jgi:Tfp pilus assembly major pilin PilA
MKEKTTIWLVLMVIGIIALLSLASPIVPHAKAKAQRITAVNNVVVVSMTVTNASALPAIQR